MKGVTGTWAWDTNNIIINKVPYKVYTANNDKNEWKQWGMYKEIILYFCFFLDLQDMEISTVAVGSTAVPGVNWAFISVSEPAPTATTTTIQTAAATAQQYKNQKYHYTRSSRGKKGVVSYCYTKAGRPSYIKTSYHHSFYYIGRYFVSCFLFAEYRCSDKRYT